MTSETVPQQTATIPDRLAGRPLVLIGLMGAGKTTVGRKLAAMLDLPFRDSDAEIEAASRMTIPELFEAYGEPEFRALEARVIGRLAAEGPQVIATGGGAYMQEETRRMFAETAVTVWLKADIDTLLERVARRSNRPLLKTGDPREIMQRLIDIRYPVYAEADITVVTRNVKREVVAADIIEALDRFLEPETAR
ncbi:shikimate kinase [Aurantimonas sp. VKM B-3413]|uniref:shikimate kinase n=1 Tax=Aurantimonas sp. VKM B-3413 TaxID=2779401 RepID=UPI001E569BFC|nr:shikimate kinase [Aurantimonas sp. VKM B-3413]MCB8837350.1 shikimate kinase [Aurantimonas sp. VKM B-3413]